MRLGRVAHATNVEAAHLLKGIGLDRLDVHLASQAHPIAALAEVMGHTGRAGQATRMVPSASVAKWILPGIEFGAAGLAHSLGKECSVKGEPLGCQLVDIRCLSVFPAVERQVVICAVVREDDEKVRLLRRGQTEREKTTEQKREKVGFHEESF